MAVDNNSALQRLLLQRNTPELNHQRHLSDSEVIWIYRNFVLGCSHPLCAIEQRRLMILLRTDDSTSTCSS